MSSGGRRIAIQGTVQGVGFRPWVYRLAHEEGLAGTVRNDAEGVTIDAFGAEEALERFLERLADAGPPAAAIRSLSSRPVEDHIGGPRPAAFTIVPSAHGRERHYSIPPDLATCKDCLEEVFDPGDRRFRYPFTNCTNCGPRFTITLDLPYDRPATTMAGFEMCQRCRAEYEDPLERRFHAQPDACPECGPQVFLLDARSERLATRSEAMLTAALAIRRGAIVAVKGLGGFHLMVDASDEHAVERLRRRKHRWEKPLALMVRELDDVRCLCRLGEREAALLSSAEAPIVLLPRRSVEDSAEAKIADGVAPDNPRLGVMLPATPLHHLLLAMVRRPVVATSGNLSDEPICIDNDEALGRLGGIADLFLVHDRPIARHADDSVALFMDGERGSCGGLGATRRAARPGSEVPTLLAVGGHMKNAVAVGLGSQVVLSQHIGDMETPQAIEAFEAVIGDLLRMLEADPVAVVHDLHPDYPSTLWARRITGDGLVGGDGATAVAPLRPARRPAASEVGRASELEHASELGRVSELEHASESGRASELGRLRGVPAVAVQHHHAHLASCLADNSVDGRAVGITFDGTGYGPDGTVWGGEVLLGDAESYERVARLRPFRLLGGEAAVREPRRGAISVLAEVFGADVLSRDEVAPLAHLAPLAALEDHQRRLFGRLLTSGLGSPLTSSAGRLFDAVAALAGLHQRVSFEGQAAMSLEFAADAGETGTYPIDVRDVDRRHRVNSQSVNGQSVKGQSGDDQSDEGQRGEGQRGEGGDRRAAPPLEIDWRPMIAAVVNDLSKGASAATVAARFHAALAVAIADVAELVGEPRVALTGGCFQNALLTEWVREALEDRGFEVLLHRRVPANDGGIALGQIAVAAARLGRKLPVLEGSATARGTAAGAAATEPTATGASSGLATGPASTGLASTGPVSTGPASPGPAAVWTTTERS